MRLRTATSNLKVSDKIRLRRRCPIHAKENLLHSAPLKHPVRSCRPRGRVLRIDSQRGHTIYLAAYKEGNKGHLDAILAAGFVG
jgi:hypothetical protein